MKIFVTQEMIDKGERCDCEHCPLALAFLALGFDIMVGPTSVSFYDADGDCFGDLSLPYGAREFQKAFDSRERVHPFSFEMPELTFPPSAIRFPQSPAVPVT